MANSTFARLIRIPFIYRHQDFLEFVGKGLWTAHKLIKFITHVLAFCWFIFVLAFHRGSVAGRNDAVEL